ncbi:conserved hypothetical protein [Candidatus Phytoplasma mali]|uniref:Peptidase M41 domain-containing protein n=2 Tax=Apple proliferation phytoplasma TaxID=37692 RepID=B3R060_PHYMT|nr:conserved hypothetical protein [Candidatus Phytoplasma mali]
MILLLEILFLILIYLTNKTDIDNFFDEVYQNVFPQKPPYEIISDQEPQKNLIDYKKYHAEEYYTAYHEAGHSLISLCLSSKSNNACQFIKADILPEKNTLGKTYTSYFSKNPMLQVFVALGGAAAELILKDDHKIPFYKVGEGCGSDLISIKKKLLKYQYSEFQMNQFIHANIKKVKFILNQNKKYLEYIADLLLSRKKITHQDVKHIIPYLKKQFILK